MSDDEKTSDRISSAKYFPKCDGTEESWPRFSEEFVATMSASSRYSEYAKQLDDDTVVILKTNESSQAANNEAKKKENALRDTDLELYKILLACFTKDTAGDLAYQLATSSVSDGYKFGCFKEAWQALKKVLEITTPQDEVSLQREYYNQVFEQPSDCPREFILKLSKIRKTLKEDYAMDIPVKTYLMDILKKLPVEYRVKKDELEKEVENDTMKTQLELLLELIKEHKRLFPEFQNKKNDTALAVGGQVKVKCFKCGEWGHKSNKCPTKKKKKGKDKSKPKKDKDDSGNGSGSDNGGKRCHYCKKKGHIKKDCFKWKAKKESQGEGA